MKKFAVLFGALLPALLVVGCFGGLNYIKGSVIMRTASEAHIDLGSEDGIQVGDTLTVWRQELSGRSITRTVRVGIVRVIRLLDDHNAAVEILTGNLRERDSVEKKIR